MKKGYFIAPGRKRINPVFLAAILLAMAGCTHPEEPQFSLAPPPPVFDPNAVETVSDAPNLMAFTGHAIPFPSHIPLSDAATPAQNIDNPADKTALRTSEEEKKCSIKDRFDRKSLLAYQWGQNRVGLNIKGISMTEQNINAVKLEYKLRLSPEKTRKEKCRYESGWQGLIGSGYNEMFLRQDNTVWHQLDEIADDADDALGKLF